MQTKRIKYAVIFKELEEILRRMLKNFSGQWSKIYPPVFVFLIGDQDTEECYSEVCELKKSAIFDAAEYLALVMGKGELNLNKDIEQLIFERENIYTMERYKEFLRKIKDSVQQISLDGLDRLQYYMHK